jgi:hypothetical protein
VKENVMARHVASIGEKKNVYKPRRKRSLGRPRHRCENNIKIVNREKGWVTLT